jgi:hypothetical protein
MADDHISDPVPVRKHGGGAYFLWPIGLMVVYVLSVGPVAKFYDGRAVPPAFTTFYTPLAATYDAVPAFRAFIDWYAALWKIKTH